MKALRPWDTGDPDADWAGYFLPGTDVLRNRVGATTRAELADAENDLVEIRVAELRDDPTPWPAPTTRRTCRPCIGTCSRTCSSGRGSCVPSASRRQESRSSHRGVAHVADEIARTDRLRGVTADRLPDVVAYLYDYVNFAHPFREGNGRAQREFFDQLLSESGRGLAWNPIDKTDLHRECHRARAGGDLDPLRALFARIVDDQPAFLYP